MSRSNELWNALKNVELRALKDSELGIYRGSDWRSEEYTRLAAVAAIETLAKLEDIDAQIGNRSTD